MIRNVFEFVLGAATIAMPEFITFDYLKTQVTYSDSRRAYIGKLKSAKIITLLIIIDCTHHQPLISLNK